jgi:GWxTD domain-containing protein
MAYPRSRGHAWSWRPLALAIAIGWVALGPARAANLPSAVQRTEHPAFRARAVPITENDSTALAIQVEIPYTALCFLRAVGGWETNFDVIVTAWLRDRQVAGDRWSESIRVAQRRELHGREARFVREYVLKLPAAEYQIEVTLTEPRCGVEGRVRLSGTVAATLAGGMRLSPILLGSCGLAGSLRELLHDRHVRLEFSDPAESVCAYVDLTHRALPADSVRVSWRLARAGDGAARGAGKASFPADSATTRLAWPLGLGGLALDAYRLEVTAALGDSRVDGSVVFGVRIESESSLTPFFNDELDALRYIASDSEVDELRTAPPAERAARWTAFWKRHDPDPETAENEFKDEFFRRLRYVETEFRTDRPGWRTDRGQVYIRYGEPDSIDSEPLPQYGFPSQVWRYDGLGLRFVFVDRTGFGDYRLISDLW